MESMDPDIDPCEDFFEYSCGSWNRLNDIPDDRSFYNTFAKLRDIILVQLKGMTKLYEPAHEILVLILFSISEGSGEPAHIYRLPRALTACIHKVWM